MPEKSVISKKDANEETRIVVENILRHHPNPFHVTSKERFYEIVDEILAGNDGISIPRHFFNLSRIASLIFDTHTQVHVTKETPGFHNSFPLRFKIFPDGLYIIAGNENYHETIGKKIDSISGRNPDDILNQLSQYSSSDNLPRKRVFAETFLYMPETYDSSNIRTAYEKIELVLEDPGGQLSIIELAETWEKGYADFSWDRLNPFIPKGLTPVHDVLGTNPPLYLQRIDDNYWYQFLDDQHKCMYIQINKQFDKDDKHSIEFHLEWTKALWESKAENIVIDLRNDPGGMTNVGSGLPSFLENMFFYTAGHQRFRRVVWVGHSFSRNDIDRPIGGDGCAGHNRRTNGFITQHVPKRSKSETSLFKIAV